MKEQKGEKSLSELLRIKREKEIRNEMLGVLAQLLILFVVFMASMPVFFWLLLL